MNRGGIGIINGNATKKTCRVLLQARFTLHCRSVVKLAVHEHTDTWRVQICMVVARDT